MTHITTDRYNSLLSTFSSPFAILDEYWIQTEPSGYSYRLDVVEQRRATTRACQFALTSDPDRTLVKMENGVVWFEQDEPVHQPYSEVQFYRIWTPQTETDEIQISCADFLLKEWNQR